MAPKNGYVPDSALVEFKTTGMRLERATHDALMRADAASGGILWLAPPGGGYRTWQNQYDMKNGIPSFAYWNLNPSSTAGLANPGYSSHGLGICADIVSAPGHSGANNWMLAHGADYGFSRPFGTNDPNHWMFAHPSWASEPSLAPQERLVGAAGARRRTAPTSQSAEAGAFLPGGTVGNFTGWIHGENVGGNDVWFQGISGNWFWSGGFTDTGTHDLVDLNPVPIPERTVLPTKSVRQRSLPSTAGDASAPELAAGTVIKLTSFTHGTAPAGTTNDVWFQTGPALWSWSGGFTDPSTTGLTEVAAPVPPPYVPPYKIAAKGIDVAASQSGINFAIASAAGVEFVIVKAGGANAGLYRSDAYPALFDAADSAGLMVGHYFNSGSAADPKTAAEFFVAHLEQFDPKVDVLMLDNEPYPGDSSGQLWTPAQAAVFTARVLELTGIDPKRFWHYATESAYGAADWAPVRDLGVRKAVAVWGRSPYPTDFSPTTVPADNTPGWPWSVHQFSDNGQLSGKTVDLWASESTTLQLFAEGNYTPPVVTPPVTDPPVTTPPSAVPSLGVVIGMIAAFFTALAALFLGH